MRVTDTEVPRSGNKDFPRILTVPCFPNMLYRVVQLDFFLRKLKNIQYDF